MALQLPCALQRRVLHRAVTRLETIHTGRRPSRQGNSLVALLLRGSHILSACCVRASWSFHQASLLPELHLSTRSAYPRTITVWCWNFNPQLLWVRPDSRSFYRPSGCLLSFQRFSTPFSSCIVIDRGYWPSYCSLCLPNPPPPKTPLFGPFLSSWGVGKPLQNAPLSFIIASWLSRIGLFIGVEYNSPKIKARSPSVRSISTTIVSDCLLVFGFLLLPTSDTI